MTALSASAQETAYAEIGKAGVATVYEASGRRGLLGGGPWECITPGRAVAGPARTALCGPGDNRAVHEAVAHVQPGEVLVLTMDIPEDVALVGDLLATQALARGAVGILVDAAVRDCQDLAAMPLTVLARWRCVRGATKEHRGETDVPVLVGGALVNPNDVVILDDDGACVVPAAELDSTLVSVRERLAKEDQLRRRWRAGELSYDVYGMRMHDETDNAKESDR